MGVVYSNPVPNVVSASGSEPGMIEKVGFATLTFFLFSIFSSAIDFIPYSAAVRPSLLAAVIGLAVVGISGRIMQIIRHRVTGALIALTAWFVVGIPLAVWPGGAASTLTSQWLVSFLSLFLTAGLIWNSDQFRKIVHLIGYSSLVLAMLALVLNRRSPDGRLMMEGRYANSNDLATILLTSLPFLGFMAVRQGNGIRRILGVVGFAPILVVVLATASRGGLVGAAAGLLVFFFHVGFAGKIKLAVGAFVVISAFVAIMPGQATARFSSLFSDKADIAQMDDATLSSLASAQSRKMLLLDSITVSFEHPFVGVGLGNFPVAQNTLALARGEEMGDWHLTHNTYTQLSSESGFPGLLLFVVAIIFCLGCISGTMKRAALESSAAWQEVRAFAVTLRVALVAFLTCAIFASLAYMPVITILSGLAIALDYCAAELATGQTAAPLVTQIPLNRPWQGTRPKRLPVAGPTVARVVK